MHGWSVTLYHDNGETHEVSGHDYMLDLFGMLELMPQMEAIPHEFNHYAPKNEPMDQPLRYLAGIF